MAPQKERVLAKILARGSAPQVEVIAKPRIKESDMPSFCSKPPLIDVGRGPARMPPGTRNIVHTEMNASDSICPGLSVRGVGRNAYRLFEMLRVLNPEPSESAFRADSAGLFWGDKKVGIVLNILGEHPTLKVWMDWLYSRPGSRAKNINILHRVPLSSLVSNFKVGAIMDFVYSFSSTQYTSITADIYSIRLELYEKKNKPKIDSFESKRCPFF
jgi:hypothetical protein